MTYPGIRISQTAFFIMDKNKKKKSNASQKRKNSFLEDVENYSGFGFNENEIANILDLSEIRLKRLKKDPLFLKAMEKGKDKTDSKIIEALFKRATGFEEDKKHYPPDTAAIIYWLNNRKSADWKRKQESADGGEGDLSNEEISKLKSIALNEAKERM